MVVKKAGIESINEIQQLAYAIWPLAYGEILDKPQLDYMLYLIYSKEALYEQVNNLQHQFIIVYEDNIPLGFASYSPKQTDDHSVYRLHKLYVSLNQQGKGIGRILLNYIINEIKPKASTLELNVNRNNPALHFYKKNGFTILREEDIDIGNGYFMNDYVMGKKL